MYGKRVTESTRIREQLPHPVIDCDAHWIQPMPILRQYVEKVAGSSIAETTPFGNALSADGRRAARNPRSFWNWPSHTVDRATAMAPGLLYERLDEFGLDFSVVMPSGLSGLGGRLMTDPDVRRGWIRGLNLMSADLFAPYGDRLTPAAVIPAVTPEEAIEELEFCVEQLGLKAVMLHGALKRPLGPPGQHGTDFPTAPYYIDTLALDSEYDYDPLWARLVELRVAPMTHAGSIGWIDRSSPSNFVNNHIGHFAQAAHAFSRALFLGGVVKRFPTLNFGFLECGVGVGRAVCTSLAAIWEKRNGQAMLENLRPSNTDFDQLMELLTEFGGAPYRERSEEFFENLDIINPGATLEELTARETALDDFAAAGVSSKEEVHSEFARNFFFGCEADDPLTALAFDPRFGVRLKPTLGSDIGHFDVPDMTTVLEEAYELVEEGLLNEDDFRDFVFRNAIDMHCGMNPDFFAGTVVEAAVKTELAAMQA